MKHEETLFKATRKFRDEDDDALLQLTILKERSDYRAYFAENRGKAEAAYSRILKENTNPGPGSSNYDWDAVEEHFNFLADFRGTLRHRFGIRDFAIRPRTSHEAFLALLDPKIDAEAIPEKVRRSYLPRLFYSPGIQQVLPRTLEEQKTKKITRDMPYATSSTDCAPYERLLKIDLRKKPAQLIREFKAALESADAHRKMDPAAYAEWQQDRSRKREEAWTHLKVWQLRRERRGFGEIAQALEKTVGAAKKSFYRAYEMIEGRQYNPEHFRRDYWEIRKTELKRTCATCPDRGRCTVLCPDVLPFVNQDEKKSSRELLISFDKNVPRDKNTRTDFALFSRPRTKRIPVG